MTAPRTATLAEWLLEQIAADEAVLPSPDGRRSTSRAWWSSDFEVVFIEEDRFAAECAAKRKIVELGPATCGAYERPGSEYRAQAEERAARLGVEFHAHVPEEYEPFCDGCAAADAANRGHEAVLRLLAAPYADREGFRDEWRA